MAIHEYRDDPTSDDPAVSSIEPIAVNHRTECPVGRTLGSPNKGRTELSAECRAAGCAVGYMHVSYVGRVASLHERNGYDDSDFFATVWDKSTGETREIMYATTRGWTYWNGAVVDLSPEDRADDGEENEAKVGDIWFYVYRTK